MTSYAPSSGSVDNGVRQLYERILEIGHDHSAWPTRTRGPSGVGRSVRRRATLEFGVRRARPLSVRARSDPSNVVPLRLQIQEVVNGTRVS